MAFRVESTRGDVVESIHRVSVAVVDARGPAGGVGGRSRDW